MKLFSKLMLLALVAGIAGLFFLKKPNGDAWLKWQDLVPDQVTQAMKKPDPTLYRWKDAKGNWQYGDTPPTDQNSQIVTNSTPVNTMKTIDLPEGYQDQGRRQGVVVGDSGSDMRSPSERRNSYGGYKAKSDYGSGSEEGSEFDPTSSSSPLSTAPLDQVPNMLNEINRINESQANKQQYLDSMNR